MNLQQIKNKLQFYKCFSDEKSKKIVNLLKRAEKILVDRNNMRC